LTSQIAVEYDQVRRSQALDTEPTPLHSKPNPQPEASRVAPPNLQPVDIGWAYRSGLLHVVNEAVLWPLGFVLVIAQSADGSPVLALTEADGPFVPDVPHGDHVAAHMAFAAMLANRFIAEPSSPESRAAAEARSRIVLPR
jgi:hypothetical protein